MTTGETANGRSMAAFSSALPRKLLADQHERADHAEHRVERHRDRHHHAREPEGVLGLRGRHGLPDGVEAVLERAVEDEARRAGRAAAPR